jgi:hypothetical protein
MAAHPQADSQDVGRQPADDGQRQHQGQVQQGIADK